MANDRFSKNVPNWKPSPMDYRLVFREVDGIWREISGNIPEFKDMILADYLSYVAVEITDGCTFCRVRRDWWNWEYRAYGGIIRIDLHKID